MVSNQGLSNQVVDFDDLFTTPDQVGRGGKYKGEVIIVGFTKSMAMRTLYGPDGKTKIGEEPYSNPPTYRVNMHCITKKAQKPITHNYSGYPEPGGKFNSMSRCGALIVAFAEWCDTPLSKVTEQDSTDLHDVLIDYMNASYPGMVVKLEEWKDFTPTYRDHTGNPITGDTVLPVSLEARVTDENLEEFQNLHPMGEGGSSNKEAALVDELTSSLMEMMHGKTISRVQLGVQRVDIFKPLPFYPKILDGTYFDELVSGGSITVDAKGKITVIVLSPQADDSKTEEVAQTS